MCSPKCLYFIYQDVSQREQAKMAVRNCEEFLKKGGFLVLIIKSRSIDVTRKTGEVAADEVQSTGRVV